MNKIDRRVKYLIGLDTETANGLIINGEMDLSQSLVYDIGWVVTDRQGRIYKKQSYIIREIFEGERDLMQSAYYAEKIPQYEEDIRTGKRKIASMFWVRKQFYNDIYEYGVKTFFAHNAPFDVRALNNTIRYITKSEFRWWFPFGSEIWDTLRMSRDTIGKQKGYISYCKKYDFMTKHSTPRVRLTAEVLYRYLTGNTEFSENHTGLEDVLIETAILAHCFRQHKKMIKGAYTKAPKKPTKLDRIKDWAPKGGIER